MRAWWVLAGFCLLAVVVFGLVVTFRDGAEPPRSSSPPPVTAHIGSVTAGWVPPATCAQVADMRALLASSTQTDDLTNLMRQGTADAALRLNCPTS